METILNETRLIDCWWSEKISLALGQKQHSATDTAPDIEAGKDFRETILAAVKKVNPKEEFEEFGAFDHRAEGESSGAGVVLHGNEGTVLVIEVYSDIAMARAWTNTLEEAKTLTKAIIEAFPKKTKPIEREDLIPVAFWHASGAEASCYIKDIKCPSFSEITQNYNKETKTSIEWLCNLAEPDSLGKIILFEGIPGSGKTHAVRAIAREWANILDATVEVILDPEQLLASAGYMRSVILSDERAAKARKSAKARKKGISNTDERPVRLIIVEDSAELFSVDCRSTPGFSRLLNLTDGIIGQGLRCIFLMTANESVGQIDPAVLRAGRCIKHVHFSSLSKKEATNWLKFNKCEDKIKELGEDDITLADLYAIKGEKREAVGTSGKFGF